VVITAVRLKIRVNLDAALSILLGSLPLTHVSLPKLYNVSAAVPTVPLSVSRRFMATHADICRSLRQ